MRVIGIGKQDFEKVRITNNFYMGMVGIWWWYDTAYQAEKVWKVPWYEYVGEILFR